MLCIWDGIGLFAAAPVEVIGVVVEIGIRLNIIRSCKNKKRETNIRIVAPVVVAVRVVVNIHVVSVCVLDVGEPAGVGVVYRLPIAQCVQFLK